MHSRHHATVVGGLVQLIAGSTAQLGLVLAARWLGLTAAAGHSLVPSLLTLGLLRFAVGGASGWAVEDCLSRRRMPPEGQATGLVTGAVMGLGITLAGGLIAWLVGPRDLVGLLGIPILALYLSLEGAGAGSLTGQLLARRGRTYRF